MTRRPFLSVVLPTRNRALLARVAARSVLAAIGSEDELIFCDNSDEPIVGLSDDPRLRVVRPGRVLSMTDNWELGVRESRGEWVLLIGDKFRLVPGFAGHAQRLTARAAAPVIRYERVRFTQDLREEELSEETLWAAPGVVDHDPELRPLQRCSSRQALEALCTDLGYLHQLPMLYNSLVHRSVIERAYAHTDQICVGCSPDVGSGMTLAVCSNEYVHTTLPFCVEQFPTRQAMRWSNGEAYGKPTPLMQQYIKDAGDRLFGDLDLPLTFSSAMFQTQYEFRRRWPRETRSIPEPWGMLAASNIHEIQARPATERGAMYQQLFRSLVWPRPHVEGLTRALLAGAYLAAPSLGDRVKVALRGESPAPPSPVKGSSFRSMREVLERFDTSCQTFLDAS